MYTGYWALFAVPIISIIGSKATYKKIPLFYVILMGTILIVPSTVNGLNYESITAELPMSSLCALMMYALFSHNDDKNIVQYCSALTLILVLLKKTGLAWAIIVLLIGFIRNKNIRLMVVPLMCGITWSAMWKLYCILMDRNVYFSTDIANTIEEIKWGGISPFVLELEKYAKSYLDAIIFEPLHTSSGGLINITPIAFCAIVLILLFLAIRMNLIPKRDGLILIGSYLLLQIIFSFIMIFMCAFVFREYQYYNPNHMVNHFISRYGIPFYLSALLMSVFAISNNWDIFNKSFKITSVIAITLFVVMSADWHTVSRTIIHSDYYQEILLQIRADTEIYYGNVLSNDKIDRAVIIENEESKDNNIERYFVRYFGAPKQLFFMDSSGREINEIIKEAKSLYKTDSIFIYSN